MTSDFAGELRVSAADRDAARDRDGAVRRVGRDLDRQPERAPSRRVRRSATVGPA